MAKKITELTALTTTAEDDLIVIEDVSTSTTKKITKADFLRTIIADSVTISGVASSEGWSPLGATPNTITNNGNRSYDLVFNSNDLTDTVSRGMRLKLTRTVTAPTQCTDLESGSSQYFTKVSPSGMAQTDDITAMAWVKLESYGTMSIISKRTASTNGWDLQVSSEGRVRIHGLVDASNYKLYQTYQSLPLNKWVHVAASMDMSANSGAIYFDGVSVPVAATAVGTANSLTNATTLYIGSDYNNSYFDGKIAQAGIFSAVLSAATIRSYASQTLSGSETSLVSAYSFNNSIADLNTTNANNLTANGSAVATNADTPFAGGATGTTEYGIVTAATFSTNTTLTVQVPEGYAIPTSGGVSAVSYSTQDTPYGFPRDRGRWRVASQLRVNTNTTSNATYGAFSSGGYALTVPVGPWKVGHQHGALATPVTTSVYFNISKTALTGLSLDAGADISPLALKINSPAAAEVSTSGSISKSELLTTASTYVMYTFGATASPSIQGRQALSEIFAEFEYV